ncbi:type VI secretion system tip protein TssI/VgrG [Herbaspirillum sp. RTI4]|uniref:type VI secretion system Vgr family protein n=4 Tax=Herbaspirillum sp. RTI4 TaxID=3048640 RepID=UPI002AB58A42|nr:type VI secretion system tip protein TssI/VgrG [Herbaspirillum sp. RTI4]MDY7578176.1 type VI secretion system tip protein TssI/VgrG [Herbaspirillum sp. RTI4]
MLPPIKDLERWIYNRQHKRILTLDFPDNNGPQSGPERYQRDALFIPNRLDADEGLSRDFTYTVEVLSDDPRIPLTDVLGKLVTLSLKRKDGSLRYFNGYVFEFGLERCEGNVVFYRMVLKPWMAFLRQRKNNAVFCHQTLNDQAMEIFRHYPSIRCDYRYAFPSGHAYLKLMHMGCQFNETDANYLHRRWEALGLSYRYEHTERGHQLMLCHNTAQEANPIDGGTPDIRFHSEDNDAEQHEAIHTWRPGRIISPGSRTTTAYNFKTAHLPSHQAWATSPNAQGNNVPQIESHDYVGAYSREHSQNGYGETQARYRMDETDAQAKQHPMAGNNRYVSPGRWFQMRKHPRLRDLLGFDVREEKQRFLIIDVRHTVTNNYLQENEPADYRNTLNCIRKSIVWRPGPGYSSNDTRIHGTQTALVVGYEQGEIATDKYGRLRVQFHWDLLGKKTSLSSAWVRMATPWAGNMHGLHTLPRPGQEVVVTWLDGNPDHPLILGSVHNGCNPPPWNLPSEKALMGLRSRELIPGKSNFGSGRSNHLILDDTLEQIQAQLKSDHQHSQLSLGFITRIEDNYGRKDARGEGYALETEGSGALRAGKGLLLTTDGRAQAVGGTLSRDELVHCLEQALEIARGLGSAAVTHHGSHRDTAPQQHLSAAVDALGKGSGPETSSTSTAAAGQAVIALSAAAGLASATPKDQTHYAGHNIDTVAGNNQQHYAMGHILHTARGDIEQLAVEGDLRQIAGKGKVTVQAQHNSMELIADKSLTITSVQDGITVKAGQYLMLQVGSSFLRMTPEEITIDAKSLILQSNAPQIIKAVGSEVAMPTFPVSDAQRLFTPHFSGDKSDVAQDHQYRLDANDGTLLQGDTGTEGSTELAQKDTIHHANIAFWKDTP